jgi:thiol-disulfide isomerase/thioredoxin
MKARQRRRLGFAGLLVAVAAATTAVVLLVTGDDDPAPVPRPTADALAASNVGAETWDLPALDGPGRVTLAQFRGLPTVVEFFTPGCEACAAALPFFRSAASSYAGEVQFVFVDTGGTGDWRDVVSEHHLDGLPLAADVRGDLAAPGDGLYRASGGTGTLPLTVFYEADGSLVQIDDRPLVSGMLRQALFQLYGIGA